MDYQTIQYSSIIELETKTYNLNSFFRAIFKDGKVISYMKTYENYETQYIVEY